MNELICSLLLLYMIILIARVLLSWFPVAPGSPVDSINSLLYRITEPVLGPVRSMLPPVGFGGMAIDLSFIVVFFGIQLVQRILCS